MDLNFINIILTVLFALAVCCALYADFRGPDAEEEKTDRLYLIAAVLIAAAGLFLRVYRFGAVPGGINQDEAMAAVDGKALADYMTDRFGTFMPAHLYAWGYGQMSSLLSYLIAVFVKLGGLSTVTARLPQLLVSIMGGAFFCLFVRDSFGRRAGFAALLLLCLNPWHIVQSRWALDCNLFPHFFMSGVYFLNRGLNGKKPALYASMLFFALSMYCYGVSVYSVPLFLVLGCVYALMSGRITALEAAACAGVYLFIAWPFILTMAINFFGWETVELPFVTLQHFTDSVRAGDILFFSDDIPAQLMQNVRCLWRVITQRDGVVWNTVPGFGTMYRFALPLMAAGAVKLCRGVRSTGRGLTLLFLLTGVAVGLITDNVNVNRANLIMYPLMLLSALGLSYMTGHVRRLRIPAVCAVLFAGVLFGQTYFGSYADTVSHSFYTGFGEALEAAEASGAEVIFVTADTQYRGSAAVSEILTLFYDKTDALYYQGKSNMNNGRQCLPYPARFVYVSMNSALARRAGEDSAFVIRREDAAYFEDYELAFYGDYAAALGRR